MFIFLEKEWAKLLHSVIHSWANVTISFRRENPTHHHVNSVTAMSIAL